MIKFLGLKAIFLLFLLGFGMVPSYAELYTTNQVVERFLQDDIRQTQAFENVCSNLNLNFDEHNYRKQIVQLKKHPQYYKSNRFRIRLFLYERYGYIRSKKVDPFLKEAKFYHILKLAIPLNDDQLLADVYAKYARVCDPIKRNYFLLKAIEIRERIGVKYFWELRADYFDISEILYLYFDYKGAVKYATRSLEMYTKEMLNDHTFLYILGADLAGASYLKVNKPDSSIYYYQKINLLIKGVEKNPSLFNQQLDSTRLAIWKGVAKGGIGKAYLKLGKHELARDLLRENLISSTLNQQWDDVADVEVSLAKIAVIQKKIEEALSRFNQGYNLALKSKKISTLIDASEGLSTLYSQKKQFDSALFYQQKHTQWNQIKNERLNQNQLDLVMGRLEFEKLQKDLRQTQSILIQQKNIRNLILITVCCLAVLAFLIYRKKRKKMHLKEGEILFENKRLLDEKISAQQMSDYFKQQAEKSHVIIDNLQTKLVAVDNAKLYNELRNCRILTDQDWNNFKFDFELMYPGFIESLKQKAPEITNGEQRIVLMAKLSLSTKEMASATGVSVVTVRSVMSRLRKKLNLETTIEKFANEI